MWVCCWQDKGRKSINIVTEKVSFQGVTRFEDRRRLPLGVATNFSAYAAKVLTQARLLPQALLLLCTHIRTWHALHHKGPPPNSAEASSAARKVRRWRTTPALWPCTQRWAALAMCACMTPASSAPPAKLCRSGRCRCARRPRSRHAL